ncbi:hypothetical protein NDU88_004305 [Pleurodeles waltl]|uniref:Uncharacterized protein n=1 Tax=Pleurodeles waltl TaxID=8319 RepID=A0AAV7SIE1_PLEWA|nr:hypothetical protein NDU88_004305 [Pleurodeles waltl]
MAPHAVGGVAWTRLGAEAPRRCRGCWLCRVGGGTSHCLWCVKMRQDPFGRGPVGKDEEQFALCCGGPEAPVGHTASAGGGGLAALCGVQMEPLEGVAGPGHAEWLVRAPLGYWGPRGDVMTDLSPSA